MTVYLTIRDAEPGEREGLASDVAVAVLVNDKLIAVIDDYGSAVIPQGVFMDGVEVRDIEGMASSVLRFWEAVTHG